MLLLLFGGNSVNGHCSDVRFRAAWWSLRACLLSAVVGWLCVVRRIDCLHIITISCIASDVGEMDVRSILCLCVTEYAVKLNLGVVSLSLWKRLSVFMCLKGFKIHPFFHIFLHWGHGVSFHPLHCFCQVTAHFRQSMCPQVG